MSSDGINIRTAQTCVSNERLTTFRLALADYNAWRSKENLPPVTEQDLLDCAFTRGIDLEVEDYRRNQERKGLLEKIARERA